MWEVVDHEWTWSPCEVGQPWRRGENDRRIACKQSGNESGVQLGEHQSCTDTDSSYHTLTSKQNTYDTNMCSIKTF